MAPERSLNTQSIAEQLHALKRISNYYSL